MFYNIVGWIYETLVCSIQEKRLVFNRGFLAGPYCPIYGSGALLDVFLLGWIHNPVLLFFAGMLVNCTLEYLTGWALEEMVGLYRLVFKYQGQDLLLGSVGLWLYVGPFDQVDSSLCLADNPSSSPFSRLYHRRSALCNIRYRLCVNKRTYCSV